MRVEPETAVSRNRETPGKKIRNLGILIVFSFSLALLYQGMRGVMHLGGYAAMGGPYLVGRQAPDWVWVMPLAILLTVASMSAGFALLRRERGFSLISLSWSALFISLGWNFLDFGLGLGGKPGPYWDDLAAALVFMLVGAIPLAVMLLDLPRRMKERRIIGAAPLTDPWMVLMQVIVAAAAVFIGMIVFRSLQ